MTTQTKLPPLTETVAVCTACHHWQADVTPRAVREFESPTAVIYAIAELHVEHQGSECVNVGGRVKVLDKWVERPALSDGKQATSVVGFHPLPRWWVWR